MYVSLLPPTSGALFSRRSSLGKTFKVPSMRDNLIYLLYKKTDMELVLAEVVTESHPIVLVKFS